MKPTLLDISKFHPHEHQVLRQIRRHGGFTDWWISENLHRIAALEKLVAKGVVKSIGGGNYPFAEYQIIEPSERRFIHL